MDPEAVGEGRTVAVLVAVTDGLTVALAPGRTVDVDAGVVEVVDDALAAPPVIVDESDGVVVGVSCEALLVAPPPLMTVTAVATPPPRMTPATAASSHRVRLDARPL